MVLEALALAEASSMIAGKDLEDLHRALREVRTVFFDLLTPGHGYKAGPFLIRVEEISRPRTWSEAVAIGTTGPFKTVSINGRRL